MIPLALTLKGFLSFREEQRLDFGHDQVWLLSGPNGSGKSTVFDAILFALYAGHRAGKADLHELINKDADRALVRFEFLLADRRYRADRMAERTTDRKTGRPGYSSSQQLYAWQDDAADWEPIAETHRQGDFHDWVRDHVGLSFDAFTSSALLMQGRADVLVAQDAEAARRRFEVLARIVGLDYYERLHRQADDLRKQNEKRSSELQAQLEILQPVDPAQLAELVQRTVALAAELTQAETKLELVHGQKSAAARWRELQDQRAAKQGEWNGMAGTLGDAPAIERDAARLAELDAVLPALQRLIDAQAQVAAAETASAALTRDKECIQARDAEAEKALECLRTKARKLTTEQATVDATRLGLAAQQHELKLAQNPLRRLFHQLAPLRQALAAAADFAEQERAAAAAVRCCEQAVEPLTQALGAATAAQHDAAQQAATAEALLADFDKQARRFAEVADAQVCSYCGQALDAEHAQGERARIARELACRRKAVTAAKHTLAAAAQGEARSRLQREEAEQALAKARRHANEIERERERTAEQSRAYERAAQDAYVELPEPYRSQVSRDMPADWTVLRFPTADDLTQLEHELARFADRLDELEAANAERQQALARLRERQQQVERDRAMLGQELTRIDGSLIQHTERLRLGREQLEPARDALPTRWQYRVDELGEAELRTLADEAAGLTQKETPARLQKLRLAQAAQEPLRRHLVELDAALAQVPAEARRDPADLEPELRAAKQQEASLRSELSQLEAETRHLEQLQERRAGLAADFRAADRRRHLSVRLAEMLSRRHLQRHLLRQAEAGIVENTNRVLDRITAGQLGVRLLPEEENGENRALQLEATKSASQQSFGLSFLSGSERFRVAIGLALGIGQYASRQHRAIESVIIDEGFGCLDRDNRRTMIDELHHLRGQLRCILLVSHQEDFVEAFPEGYRFRIADGMTRVERNG